MSSSSESHSSSATPPLAPNVEEIKASLKRHNDSFDQLLRYIPAQYYIPAPQQVHVPVVPLTKAQKKAAKKKSQDVLVKAAKSEALRKAKLARYDPDQPKTIPEIQKAKADAAALKGKAKASGSDASSVDSDWEDSSAAEDDEEDDEEAGDSEADSANDTDFADSDDDDAAAAGPGGRLHHPSAATGPAASITELREKLQRRILDIQAHKRNGGAAPSGESGAAETVGAEESAQSREELLEERRRQRGALRDNRRRKRKAERREEKSAGRGEKKERVASNGRKGGGKANAPPKEPRVEHDEDGGEDEDRPRKKSKATPPASKSVAAPAVVPSKALVVAPPAVIAPKPAAPAADLSFSTLDFSTSTLLAANTAGSSKLAASLNKVKKNRHALPKDPNAALEVLAKRKERLELLNPEQRERKEDKDRWEKVELKAGGEKVRDDEKRLKKMAKRQEKIKSKSAKAWAERKETVSSTITAKVTKRNNNLAARVQQAKDKKAGIKTKTKSAVKTTSKSFASRNKGRPGFEGGQGKKKK